MAAPISVFSSDYTPRSLVAKGSHSQGCSLHCHCNIWSLLTCSEPLYHWTTSCSEIRFLKHFYFWSNIGWDMAKSQWENWELESCYFLTVACSNWFMNNAIMKEHVSHHSMRVIVCQQLAQLGEKIRLAWSWWESLPALDVVVVLVACWWRIVRSFYHLLKPFNFSKSDFKCGFGFWIFQFTKSPSPIAQNSSNRQSFIY